MQIPWKDVRSSNIVFQTTKQHIPQHHRVCPQVMQWNGRILSFPIQNPVGRAPVQCRGSGCLALASRRSLGFKNGTHLSGASSHLAPTRQHTTISPCSHCPFHQQVQLQPSGLHKTQPFVTREHNSVCLLILARFRLLLYVGSLDSSWR